MGRQINGAQLRNCYHIFGYDLLFEGKDMKPWLIEINHYPSLRGTFADGKGDSEVKAQLAYDFYYFIVKPYFYVDAQPESEVIDHWLLCTENIVENEKSLRSGNRKKSKSRAQSRKKL